MPSRWPRAPLPRHRGSVAVIAHRGAHEIYPENSIDALLEAIRLGVDLVEVDLRTTLDGVIVNLHDRTVDRTTPGSGPLAEKTAAEAAALGIPTFAALLDAAEGRVGFYVDAKDVDPAQAWALIARHEVAERCLVYTSTAGALAWKRVAPQLPVMASPPKDRTLADFLTEWPFELLDGPAILSPEQVAEAAAFGASVWADVQDDGEGPARWEDALSRGITGLQTDRPAALIAWLESTGRR